MKDEDLRTVINDTAAYAQSLDAFVDELKVLLFGTDDGSRTGHDIVAEIKRLQIEANAWYRFKTIP